jgi:molecular chaperone GrpE
MPSSPGSEGGARPGASQAAPHAEQQPQSQPPPDGQAQPQGQQQAEPRQGGPPAGAGEDSAAQLAQMEDRLRRALADLDNYRKRTAREVERRVAESREALLREWLEAVDSVERALRMQEPGNPLFEGLRSVLEQMEAILARNGVQRIGTAGEHFDPERHEAISVQENDEVDDRTVLETARSGFALGDRVLRPAQVVVSRRDGRQP